MDRMRYLGLPSLLNLLSTITSPHLEEMVLGFRDRTITDPSSVVTFIEGFATLQLPALRRLTFALRIGINADVFASWLPHLRHQYVVAVVNNSDE